MCRSARLGRCVRVAQIWRSVRMLAPSRRLMAAYAGRYGTSHDHGAAVAAKARSAKTLGGPAVSEPVTVQLDERNIGSTNTEAHVVPVSGTTVFAFDVGDRLGLSILPEAGGTAIYRVVVSKSECRWQV